MDDLELNQLYPVPIPKDPIQLEISDKKEQDEHKTPILPPLKAGPCHKQIQSDIAPSSKQIQGVITPGRKQSQGDITPHRKESLGETKNVKEMKLMLPDRLKSTAN